MFLVQPRDGESLDVGAIRARLETMGESVLVAGDARAVKIHVHNERPDAVIAFGLSLGVLSRIVVENMDNPANWGANGRLAKEVALVNFLQSGQLHTETDDLQATFNIGGIVGTATIAELPDPEPNSTAHTGVFEITFDTYQLPAHPDPDVEWHRGTVRISEDAPPNAKKTLAVWKIDTSGSTLKLTAFDSTLSDPGYKPIRTGGAVPVNFHPGYRVYLKAQAGVLDETATLPPAMQTSRQTLLAARSREISQGNYQQRVEVKTQLAISLPDEDARIEPVPLASPTGKPEVHVVGEFRGLQIAELPAHFLMNFRVLDEANWVYRQQADGKWRTYQSAINAGRLSEIPQSHYHPRTGELVLDAPQVRVTPKGIADLRALLGGTVPLAIEGAK